MDASVLYMIAVVAPPAIFAITVHEVAHGYVAKLCGDPTAANARRLTLNPVNHVDPVGTLLIPGITFALTGFVFGWAKPVPVDWRRLDRPRRDIALVALAGPAANLLMLFGWIALARSATTFAPGSALAAGIVDMCRVGFVVNAILMLLNLLPVPPLDGSRVVTVLLPRNAAAAYNRAGRYGLIIVALLLVTGILAFLIVPPLNWVLGWAAALAGI
mgnify:CR=1 FL=1